jgi:hypothetical protein
MVELETINLLVQIVGVSATAIAAVVGVRSYINSSKRAEELKRREQETRELDIYMQLVRQTRTPEFMKQWATVSGLDFKDNADFFKKYGPTVDPDVFSAYLTVIQTYNCIALLVKKGTLSIETLYNLVVFQAFKSAWAKAKLQMKGWSEDYGYNPWEALEWLIGEIDRYIETKKSSSGIVER